MSNPNYARGAGVHVPPPFYYAAPFVAGFFLHRTWPVDRMPLGDTFRLIVGGLLLASGVLLVATAIAWFRRLRVSIIPFRPAARLVSQGPYRISRNPMYLGQVFVYTGLAFVLNIAWPLALLPVSILLIDRLVIVPEERHLRAAFAAEFVQYSARVRRWL